MADNFNITTTQGQADIARGIDPSNPTQNFGSEIANNGLAYQNQEQLVKQAVEKTKQAKIGTAEAEKIFDTEAYLSEKGLMPKSQAIAELKLVLDRQGAEQEEIDKDVAVAEKEFPQELDGQAIWRFYNALREKKEPSVKATGQAFQSSGDEKDVNDKPFSKGTWIQESADSEGNQIFVRSNEPSSMVNASAKKGVADSKELKEFGKEISGMLKTRFGTTGMLATTVFRADRALNTIHASPVLTKQDLDNISTDIAAIYQGGVPGQAQIMENAYGTTLTNIMDTLRHYTGVLSGFGMNHQVLGDTKMKLTKVLTDMRNSALASLEQIFKGIVSHYPSLSADDPAVIKIIQDTMSGLSSGMLNGQGEVVEPTGSVPVVSGSPEGAKNDPLGIRS